jgi:hypothetical protein
MFILFLSLFAIAIQGYVLGPRCVRGMSVMRATIWGVIGTVASIMLVRGAWFYLGLPLDLVGGLICHAIVIILGTGYAVWQRRLHHHEARTDQNGSLSAATYASIFHPTASALALLSTAIFLIIAFAASRAGTVDAIRTPWPLMPTWTLPLIGMLWVLALVSAWKARSLVGTTWQVICAIGATLTLAPLLYRLGYGFDGFLHVAGEQALLRTGLLTPKPPYYMGQYVLVTWLAQLLRIGVATIDRWLVPVSATLLIPFAWMPWVKTHGHALYSQLPALILLPLSAYVATTPHGFALVLAMVVFGLCVTGEQHPPKLLLIILALWCALTHPLVGLPVLFATGMYLTHTRFRGVSYACAVAAGAIVPVVFGLQSLAHVSTGVPFHLETLLQGETWKPLIASWIPWVQNTFVLWPETTEWVVQLLPVIAVLLALLGAWRARKNGMLMAPWILAAGTTFIASLVLRIAGDVSFVIDYERSDYAERLALMSYLFLLPLAIPELGKRLGDASRGAWVSLLALLVALGLTGAALSYAALPRHDAAAASRGWSMGRADIEAVKLIEDDSNGAPYTVLANQTVSAAAVKTLGFKRYNDGVFFYPIPTGGPLYEVFIRAAYQTPSREVMQEAAQLGGSRLVYFVVNEYWWRAEDLMEAAEATADRTFVIRDGTVRVFKYEF